MTLSTLRVMQPLSIHAIFKGRFRRVLLCTALALSGIVGTQAASLQTFPVLFFQVPNDIATIESSFDNSSTQKQTLAQLSRETPHSANAFQVSAPQMRYEVAQGLASWTYTEDVFAPGATPLDATRGTFFYTATETRFTGCFRRRDRASK